MHLLPWQMIRYRTQLTFMIEEHYLSFVRSNDPQLSARLYELIKVGNGL
jgi:hypothetical protein